MFEKTVKKKKKETNRKISVFQVKQIIHKKWLHHPLRGSLVYV